MPRGLVTAENPVSIARMRGINASRGLVANERIRQRFIRPRRYWGNPQDPVISPGTATDVYPIIGGSYYPT